MKTRIIVMILGMTLCLAALSGCSLFRESLLEMSREDVKNAETVRAAAINFAKTWETNSGFIRGSLGFRIKEFPIQFGQAMDELDELFIGKKGENGEFIREEDEHGVLIAKQAVIDQMSDYDLSYGLGLRVRTCEALIQEALKTYASDVLDLIPFPLKF